MAWKQANEQGLDAVIALFKTTFGDLLANKQCEAFVRHVDLGAIWHWGHRRREVGNERRGEYFLAMEAEGKRLADSVTTSGACDLEGVRFDSALLETARYELRWPGVLFVFPGDAPRTFLVKDGVTPQPVPSLVYVGPGMYIEAERLEANYREVVDYLDKRRTEALQRYADVFCVNAALDGISLTIESQRVEPEGDLLVWALRGSASSVLNTPVVLQDVQPVFRDSKGVSVRGHAEISPVLVLPGKSVPVNWRVALLSEERGWVERVADGTATVRFRAHTMRLARESMTWRDIKITKEESLRRDEAFMATTPVARGQWQLGGFAPVTLTLPRATALKFL